MANEFKHKDPGSELTQAEFIASDGTGHIFESQAAGDILYASSTTALARLGVATNGNVLELSSGLPAWTASPTIGSTSWANANHAHAATNSGGTVTATSATVATTVTITDNESTNENNVLVFVADADADGGNVGLESDGTLHYNPSSGLVTATGFSGTLTGTLQTGSQTNITAVGTITAGTWEGTTVAVDQGGTGATSLTANGILVGNSTSAIAVTATMATKGHLMVGDGSGVPSMLAVGGTADHVLTVDSGEGTGMKWAAAGGGGIQSALQSFIETGTYKVLYLLGGADSRTFASANDSGENIVGMGFVSHNSSSGSIVPSTVIRGGWTLSADSSGNSITGFKTTDDLDPVHDWTLVARIVWPSSASQTLFFGMSKGSDVNDAGLSNDAIGFRVSGTGNIFAFTDSGGTETTDDSGTAPSATERTLRIEIRSAGTTIEFFVDNASIGSISANIPTGQTFSINVAVKSTSGVKVSHIADIAAWREV
jgi:hypothetical protein